MTGIMPTGGVTYDNAFNTIPDPLLEEGCKPTWHAPRCVPKFDPAAANAIQSELLNLMKCMGVPYDCNELDNLCQALTMHEISGRQSFEFSDTNTPIAVPNGVNASMGGGTFRVPNTFRRDVGIFMAFESTIQFEQIGGGGGATLDMDIDVNALPDFSGAVLANLVYRVRSFTDGQRQFASNPTSYRGGIVIPPGGRDFYWRARVNTGGGNNNWQLQYTERALAVTIYGVGFGVKTRDIF